MTAEELAELRELEKAEGDLGENDMFKDKNNECDFVLWKASKENEPSWKS